MHLGSYAIDDLLTFTCNTHTPSTGAAVDADAVPGYRVYEDETGTPLLTGSMAKLDDDNTTGFYSEQITLSAANGFEAGKCYTIRITGVVGGVTGVTERSFQVGAKVALVDDAITAAKVATGAIDADALASDAVDEILDEAVEGTTTVREALRLIMAALLAKVSGCASNAPVFRDIGDTKNRITAVTDGYGNRTSVTLDGS